MIVFMLYQHYLSTSHMDCLAKGGRGFQVSMPILYSHSASNIIWANDFVIHLSLWLKASFQTQERTIFLSSGWQTSLSRSPTWLHAPLKIRLWTPNRRLPLLMTMGITEKPAQLNESILHIGNVAVHSNQKCYCFTSHMPLTVTFWWLALKHLLCLKSCLDPYWIMYVCIIKRACPVMVSVDWIFATNGLEA